MNRERVTYLAIFAVLSVIGIWVARNTYWDDTLVPMPLKGEAATNPYYSVQHLVKALGMRSRFVISLSSASTPQGVLLLDGFEGDMTHAHLDDLKRWVESGGRLIIADYMLRADGKLQDWSQLHLGTRFAAENDTAGKSGNPPVSHDPGDECSALSVARDGHASEERLTLCIPFSEFAWVSTRKAAWSLANRFGLQIVRVNMGQGSVTVIPSNALISNRNLLRHDHAEIFIAASGLAKGDILYIVNEAQAEKLLGLIWQLAAPALLFFGIAILAIILRELPRFGPALPVPLRVRRSLAEQIRANAAFAWRTRKLSTLRAAVRRALDDAAQKRIAAYNSLDIRKRVTAIAAYTGTDPKKLNSAMTEDAAATPPIQRAAIVLLEEARRQLNVQVRKDQGRV